LRRLQCIDAIIFRVGTVEDERPMEVEGGHQVKASRRAQVGGGVSSSRDLQ
jgi:hypothetical protein